MNTQLGVPHPAPPSHGHGLSYYGPYEPTSYEPEAQNLLPQYVTNAEGQSWTALHDTRSLPEVADPYLGQNPQVLLPYDTFGSGTYEPGAQAFLPQHRFEEQNLSVLRRLWGSSSEVAGPRLVQYPKLLPYPNSGFTSYELEVQDLLSQYAAYSEGQTWPALCDPWVTQTLPEEAGPHLGQPPQDPSPYGTESTSYVPGAHDILPQPEHSSYSEEQTWPGSSSRHDQLPPPPMVQGRQNRVMCAHPGAAYSLRRKTSLATSMRYTSGRLRLVVTIVEEGLRARI
ncbi:uncharacterized protein BJ212DRAFT_1303867 [Suillus subaureus]|uniref:Uncharacterized protein n=1 Tax=Suillus subaureus TaxID=48587 RepID=A0A9P7DXV9_9AGAM|nr:uncharacterized protein BJ212DRAFT_1303867 [Suillus subaureus]KAG1805795.1 hypothetical protein BJ212DRAFT_1303867 [Suillus subaureus]